jgi:anion-transporting  ArsA/GET3 family ATPase
MIVAGKGGVGKTTVSAALARMAAQTGKRTLVVEVEGTTALPALFGRHDALGYKAVTLRPATNQAAEIIGRTIRPDDALVEYLEDHGLRRVSKRMSTTGTLDLVATAIPGIKDILVLGKVKQLAQAADRGGPDAVDLIIVDAPAAGHAVSFLSSARGLLDAIAAGPIRTQAGEVVELITDPARCEVLLVTLPEETPVNEAIETAFHLEDRAGVALGPIIVNGLFEPLGLPSDAAAAVREAGRAFNRSEVKALGDAAAFRRRREELQAEQVERLAAGLPLAQLHLPNVWRTDLGPDDVETLAAALAAAVLDLEPTGAGRPPAAQGPPGSDRAPETRQAPTADPVTGVDQGTV